jgi:hypothetical protein
MHDREASAFLDVLPEAERYAMWHLAFPDGATVGRGTGGVGLLGAMSVTRPASRVLAHVPGGILDRAYEVVASHRGRLGRLVPDGPGPRRFP